MHQLQPHKEHLGQLLHATNESGYFIYRQPGSMPANHGDIHLKKMEEEVTTLLGATFVGV